MLPTAHGRSDVLSAVSNPPRYPAPAPPSRLRHRVDQRLWSLCPSAVTSARLRSASLVGARVAAGRGTVPDRPPVML